MVLDVAPGYRDVIRSIQGTKEGGRPKVGRPDSLSTHFLPYFVRFSPAFEFLAKLVELVSRKQINMIYLDLFPFYRNIGGVI